MRDLISLSLGQLSLVLDDYDQGFDDPESTIAIVREVVSMLKQLDEVVESDKTLKEAGDKRLLIFEQSLEDLKERLAVEFDFDTQCLDPLIVDSLGNSLASINIRNGEHYGFDL